MLRPGKGLRHNLPFQGAFCQMPKGLRQLHVTFDEPNLTHFGGMVPVDSLVLEGHMLLEEPLQAQLFGGCQ